MLTLSVLLITAGHLPLIPPQRAPSDLVCSWGPEPAHQQHWKSKRPIGS